VTERPTPIGRSRVPRSIPRRRATRVGRTSPVLARGAPLWRVDVRVRTPAWPTTSGRRCLFGQRRL